MQTAMGWEDTPENMQTFLRAALGPGGVDERKLEAYCRGSIDHYQWLVNHGVAFVCGPDPEGSPLTQPAEDGFVDVGGQEYAGGGLVWSGGEWAFPFSELTPAVPRGHIPRDPTSDEDIYEGAAVRALLATAASLPIRVRFNTGAERLIVDSDGGVVGVEAQTFDGPVRIRARGGVVLTTGGFSYNEEMMAKHSPYLVELKVTKMGHGGQDGLGIRMGQSTGAEVLHMDAVDVTLLMTPPMSFRAGVIFNQHGQRFINEDTYYGRIGAEALLRQNGLVYLMVDDEIFIESSWRRPSWVTESIEELEDQIGIPAGALKSTIELYNRNALAGSDPVFHKDAKSVQPLKPPYAVIDLRHDPGPSPEGVNYLPRQSEGPADMILGGTVTLGGLHTTPDSEVVSVSGEQVSGLYAAGRATSGLSVYGYCSGISLGDGSFFGRRAGLAAARRGRQLSV
jgi:3-oxo-5alpha-steroid 4-dehydrogenase